MKVIYDTRTKGWVEWDENNHSYLAPELYFEIKESPDEYYYHSFYTNDGIKEFKSINEKEFFKKFNKLDKEFKIQYRTSWSLPKEQYEEGLKFFNLKK